MRRRAIDASSPANARCGGRVGGRRRDDGRGGGSATAGCVVRCGARIDGDLGGEATIPAGTDMRPRRVGDGTFSISSSTSFGSGMAEAIDELSRVVDLPDLLSGLDVVVFSVFAVFVADDESIWLPKTS